MKTNSLFLSRRRGFTLIELLVVLTIMAVLTGMVGPNLIQSMQGSSLSRAGALVQNNLKMAHQYALSHQNTVEVRFYQYTDPTIAGATNNFRALQLIEVVPQAGGTTTNVPLTQVISLPTPNIMIPPTGTTQYSTLLAFNDSATTTPSASDPSIPVVGHNYTYVEFGFLPNGGTNLTNTTGQLYYVTVSASSQATSPKNFYTIQVDPLTGKITSYRP